MRRPGAARTPGAASALGLGRGVLIALLLGGCATPPWDPARRPGTAPAPDVPWSPAAEAAARTTPAPVPLAAAGTPHGLAELVDLGLTRHPDTRAAWLAARSAAAALGTAESAYLPTLNLTVAGARTRAASAGGSVIVGGTSYGPALDSSWLLFDFGGRRANVEQARQALIAADWTHNAALNDRVLAITRAFHAHQAALALAASEQAAVKAAQAALDAAEVRRQAGVATVSDVLQAKTALSRAQLLLESADGSVVTTRADLNTAVGLPAAAATEVEPLPATMPLEELKPALDALIAEAVGQRPEIGAAEAQVRRAVARVTAVRSAGRPTVGLNGTFGRTWFTNPTVGTNVYTGAITLRFPVFTGFAQRANELAAQADLEQARARAEALRQQVENEVVKSTQTLLTAAQRVRTSADLVASAGSNQEVALGRYRAGAGSILELLTAQSALEDARAQDVQARADWLAAVAGLARARGTARGKGTTR